MAQIPPSVPEKKVNPSANGSLIFALISILMFAVIFITKPAIRIYLTLGELSALIATILGIIALVQIKRSAGAQTGKSWAILGIVIPYIALFIFVSRALLQ